MRSTGFLLLTASLFIWTGLVLGISCLEAPLKFTAPHITLALGVGIGRVVFHALNNVEIGLGAGALVLALYLRVSRRLLGTLLATVAVLLLQTFWLLPALDVRAETLLSGHPAPPNVLHPVYISAEVLKLLLLLTAGTLAFRTAARPTSVAYPSSSPPLPMTKSDIETEDDIHRLVNTFYQKVRADAVLAPSSTTWPK